MFRIGTIRIYLYGAAGDSKWFGKLINAVLDMTSVDSEDLSLNSDRLARSLAPNLGVC